jgi:hypothetical protein
LARCCCCSSAPNHLYEYSVDDYAVLPTIDTRFLLNFISAALVGALLATALRVRHSAGGSRARRGGLSHAGGQIG